MWAIEMWKPFYKVRNAHQPLEICIYPSATYYTSALEVGKGNIAETGCLRSRRPSNAFVDGVR